MRHARHSGSSRVLPPTYGRRPAREAPVRPTTARPTAVRTRAVVWVVALATVALGLVGVPPATARSEIGRKIAAASDDLAAASKAVTRAAAALDLARVQLPAAQQVL